MQKIATFLIIAFICFANFPERQLPHEKKVLDDGKIIRIIEIETAKLKQGKTYYDSVKNILHMPGHGWWIQKENEKDDYCLREGYFNVQIVK